MNRRGFIGTVSATIGGFFIPQKLKSDAIIKTDFDKKTLICGCRDLPCLGHTVEDLYHMITGRQKQIDILLNNADNWIRYNWLIGRTPKGFIFADDKCKCDVYNPDNISKMSFCFERGPSWGFCGDPALYVERIGMDKWQILECVRY